MRITKDTVAICVLTIILAVLSVTNIVVARTARDNQLDRHQFPEYMRCLIVPDEAKYKELGRDGYVRYCERILREEDR